jgi:tetratricopeptide (TPR) repeat protein
MNRLFSYLAVITVWSVSGAYAATVDVDVDWSFRRDGASASSSPSSTAAAKHDPKPSGPSCMDRLRQLRTEREHILQQLSRPPDLTARRDLELRLKLNVKETATIIGGERGFAKTPATQQQRGEILGDIGAIRNILAAIPDIVPNAYLGHSRAGVAGEELSEDSLRKIAQSSGVDTEVVDRHLAAVALADGAAYSWKIGTRTGRPITDSDPLTADEAMSAAMSTHGQKHTRDLDRLFKTLPPADQAALIAEMVKVEEAGNRPPCHITDDFFTRKAVDEFRGFVNNAANGSWGGIPLDLNICAALGIGDSAVDLALAILNAITSMFWQTWPKSFPAGSGRDANVLANLEKLITDDATGTKMLELLGRRFSDITPADADSADFFAGVQRAIAALQAKRAAAAAPPARGGGGGAAAAPASAPAPAPARSSNPTTADVNGYKKAARDLGEAAKTPSDQDKKAAAIRDWNTYKVFAGPAYRSFNNHFDPLNLIWAAESLGKLDETASAVEAWGMLVDHPNAQADQLGRAARALEALGQQDLANQAWEKYIDDSGSLLNPGDLVYDAKDLESKGKDGLADRAWIAFISNSRTHYTELLSAAKHLETKGKKDLAIRAYQKVTTGTSPYWMAGVQLDHAKAEAATALARLQG